MRAPGEVPGLSCSRGKAISPTGAAWLPVNNVTHKLIMLVSLLTPLLLPAASRLTRFSHPLGVPLAFHLRLSCSNPEAL